MTRTPRSTSRHDTRDAGVEPAQAQRLRAEAEARSDPALAGPALVSTPQRLRDDSRLGGYGTPLPAALRHREEARLGADLSRVRLHSDAEAQGFLAETNAHAAARGTQIAVTPEDARADTPRAQARLAHETTHVAQQARPGSVPMVQRDDKPEAGIGNAPPDAEFEVNKGGKGEEDKFALFERGSATLSGAAKAQLLAAAKTQKPNTLVTIHGYASLEGSDRYNLNLSAHRAVAIRDALKTVMPDSTMFDLVAHGETDAFGKARENRRGGVDFFNAGAKMPLSLTTPSLGLPKLGEYHLMDPDALRLDPIPPLGPTPGVPSPRHDQFTLPTPPVPSPDAVAGVGLPPPPSIFPRGFDFGDVARDAGSRGTLLSEGDAAALTQHYLFWRDFYYRMGLSPEQASDLAQAGTSFAGSKQLSFDAPYAWETFNRTHDTELPPTVPLVPIFQYLKKKLE